MFFNGCCKLSVQPLTRTHNKGCTLQTFGEKLLSYLYAFVYFIEWTLSGFFGFFFHVLMLNLTWLIFLRHLGL